MTLTTTERPTRRINRIDVGLSKWQKEALYRCDAYRWLFLIGGRGSGKSFLEKFIFYRWLTLSTELHWGIFGATTTVLDTILAPFTQLLDELEIEYCYGQEPDEWRDGWMRDGIKVPARRRRASLKLLILRNGAHFVLGSLMNSAYTRFKSFEFNGLYFGEGLEPGVDLDAITTLWGATRCGKATEIDGVWLCREPGHLHQLVLGANEPLNDPSHWVYKKHEELTAQEAQRKLEGKPPFYRVIFSSTFDNRRLGETFVDGLSAAMDAETFKSQTAPQLRRNVSQLSYHAFSEQNILASLTYGSQRPLHMWFDFNHRPAIVGWGHDLRADEVPGVFLRAGLEYFGANGELFSGRDSMLTDAVAHALLEDPGATDATARCRETECGHPMAKHIEMAQGAICKLCDFHRGSGKSRTYCQAGAISMGNERKYIHAAPNWRGLIQHRADIYVYGDASGNQTHADGVEGGCWQILRNVFYANLGERVHFRVKASNPAINLRVLAVNSGLKAANGIRRHFFAPWMVEHIADFREVIPGKDGNPLKKNMTPQEINSGRGYAYRSHASDAWGYHADFRWPAVMPKAGALPSVASEVSLGPMETRWPDARR